MRAHDGDLPGVKEALSEDSELVHSRDANDWTPLHEAGRGGHLEVLKYLVERGGDLNFRTNKGTGRTVLGWIRELGGGDNLEQWVKDNGGEI